MKIEGNYIGNFLVSDIETSIKRTTCNSIDRIEVANTIVIEIHKDANKIRYEFDQSDMESFKQMTFDRLQRYGDITSIQFELEKNHVEEEQSSQIEFYNYHVNWTKDSKYTNAAQKTYLSRNGNLYLVISDVKNIEDFFDLEE